MAAVTNWWTGETREYPGLKPSEALMRAWFESGFKPGEPVRPMVLSSTMWLGDFYVERTAAGELP